MQKDFMFKFFQDFPIQLRELEKYMNEDNVLKTDIVLKRMEKLITKLKTEWRSEIKKAIQGDV